MTAGPYTTITVGEYGRLESTITVLRKRVQKARELLEQGHTQLALQVLKIEADDLSGFQDAKTSLGEL